MTTLYVSFPLNCPDLWEIQEKIEKAIKRTCDGSGAGFGMRDLDWRFTYEIDAKKAADRVKALNIEGCEIDICRN